jgi:signal transduction histidine kinase
VLFAVTAAAVVMLVVSGASWPGYLAVVIVAVASVLQHSTLGADAVRRVTEIIAEEDPDAPTEAGEVAEAVRERIIAERRSAERRNADLRAALLASGVGVVVADRDGRVLNAVGATTELLPAGAGGSIKNPALLRLFASALDGGEPAMEIAVMGVRNRVMQWIAVPLDAAEVGAVVTDVTEMQRVQNMRRNFVTDASHELKTPIAAIQAAAEVLQATIGTDEARSLLFARRLEEQAIRLGRIVNDLLDLSRLESDSPEMELFDLTAAVSGEVALAHSEADEADIELSLELEDVRIVGNRADVGLAVRNLITNAIRYTPAGGNVDVSLRVTDQHAVVEVTDSGIGIAASDQERVFERFFRVDSARSRATGGTGLGLSIVRHVMHHHGGRAEVESVSGHGSTFRLHFPR